MEALLEMLNARLQQWTPETADQVCERFTALTDRQGNLLSVDHSHTEFT